MGKRACFFIKYFYVKNFHDDLFLILICAKRRIGGILKNT